VAAIYIVEGVPGSGKDTLVGELVQALRPEERRVLVFPEEAVLATWLYYFLPGIHELRLHLTHRIVDYAQVTLRRDPDTAFVFNRFHVSHAVWRGEQNADPRLEGSHDRLVEKLTDLPVQILHAVLTEAEMDERSRHVERRDIAWQRFLEERLAFQGKESTGATYFPQQGEMTRIMERDGLPYTEVRVQPGAPLDLSPYLTNQ
jgi:hypothetical protein